MSRSAEHQTVGEFPQLDARKLKRGFCEGGRVTGELTWMCRGAVRAKAQILTDAHGLTATHGGRSYRVQVQHERCHFGGTRPWFLCPANGCGRRCAILYLRSTIFACRRCQRLVYPSQREGISGRAFLRRDRALDALGAKPGAHQWEMVKPPRMWWRTFERLRETAAREGLAALCAGMKQLGLV